MHFQFRLRLLYLLACIANWFEFLLQGRQQTLNLFLSLKKIRYNSLLVSLRFLHPVSFVSLLFKFPFSLLFAFFKPLFFVKGLSLLPSGFLPLIFFPFWVFPLSFFCFVLFFNFSLLLIGLFPFPANCSDTFVSYAVPVKVSFFFSFSFFYACFVAFISF